MQPRPACSPPPLLQPVAQNSTSIPFPSPLSHPAHGTAERWVTWTATEPPDHTHTHTNVQALTPTITKTAPENNM